MIIENPCFVPTDDPSTSTDGFVPAVNPAAAADAYPTSSLLNVFLFPPAFQHHAT